MSGPSGVRVTIVVDHPIQYFSPAFVELQRSTSVTSTVLYWATHEEGFFDRDFGRDVRWDIDLLSGYRYVVAGGGSTAAKVRDTMRHLQNERPDVVLLFGWSDTVTRAALAWSFVRRVPALLYGDSTPQHGAGGPRGRRSKMLLRVLMKIAGGAFTTGAFNRDFYRVFGMPDGRLYEGVLPADVDMYSAGRDVQRDDTFTIGYSGKLIERKGVDELLTAISILKDTPLRVLIIGDGPLRSNLEAQARTLGIDSSVEFLGFRNQSELPHLLGRCHVVVVPSRIDFRVLVVAEAIAAGAAVIVSSKTAVWGPGDLVEHDQTGLVYESGRPAELAAAIRCLAQEPDLLERLRAKALSRIEEYGPKEFALRLERAALEITTRARGSR